MTGWICDSTRGVCIEAGHDAGPSEAAPADSAPADAAPEVAVDATLDAPDSAAPRDAPPLDEGPGDAPPDAPLVNLAGNAGCENGTVGWMGWQATLVQSTTSHSGTFSCQVCVLAGYDAFTLDDDDENHMSTVYSPRAGERYVGRAWVRASPGTRAQQIRLYMREWSASGVQGGKTATANATVDQAWQQLEVQHTMTADRYALDFYIANEQAQDGDCFLADDLEVYLLP